MRCLVKCRGPGFGGSSRELLRRKWRKSCGLGLRWRGEMTEQELLVDCLARLNKLGADYYLTGSMASNYWGIPRTTHDLDFVVRIEPEAVKRMVEIFRDDYYVDE